MPSSLTTYNSPTGNQLFSKSIWLHKEYFFSLPSGVETSEAIKSILQLPYSLFIEIGQHDKREQLLQNLWYGSPDMVVSLTTASCYTSNLAHSLTHNINSRFDLNDHNTMQIATCLHEAIMNSMLHGNLGMKSDFRTLEDLCTYQTEIEQRLNIDIYKLLRINIRIWNKSNYLKIAVSDQGDGFSIPDYIADDTPPNGRGLMFINSLASSVWVGKDKHTLFMTFNKDT